MTKKFASKSANTVFESGSIGVVSTNIDESAHVIKHAKILGKTSINNRDYGPAINPKSLTAYEGAPVFAGHVAKPGQSRNGSYGDRIGTIRNPSIESDGLYGNIHYNPEHPLAKSLVWEAKNEPKNLGLSHHADLAYSDRNQSIVESIEKVHSVDLVNRPATTNGLFESENPVKTLKQVIESIAKDSVTGDTLAMRTVLEDMMGDAAVAATPVDAPVGSSADDQVKAAFRAMVVAAVDDESLDMKATLAKIKDILNAQEKLSGKAASKSGGGDSTPPGETPAKESVEDRLTRYERTEEVRGLAEEEGIKLEPIHIKAAVAMESVEDRAAFVKSLPKPSAATTIAMVTKPARSGSVTALESAEEPPKFATQEERLAFLRSR